MPTFIKLFITVGLAMLLSIPVASAQISIPDMLEGVLPAVVTVAIKSSDVTMQPFGFASGTAEIAYERVLDLSNAHSSGSGFVIDRGGKKYVITNAHVVQNAVGEGSIVVYSIDQSEYTMKIVGGDSFYDVAVLEFVDPQPGKEIKTIHFREGEVRIGETVFAIGNPLGEYPYTVTNGIIGGKNRLLDGMTAKYGYLQSSATVIWGNSGGPLVDVRGNVVGINTRIGIKEMETQAFIQPQLNFALEAGVASRIVNDIITNNGRVRRAYLGLVLSQSYTDQCDFFGNCVWTEQDELPVLTGFIPGSPASAAFSDDQIGFPVGAINGVRIRNIEEALGELEQVRPGANVEIGLDLAGKIIPVTFKTEELTEANLATLATYTFQEYGGMQLTETGGTVEINELGIDLDVLMQLFGIESEGEGFVPVEDAGDVGNTILAAGIVVDNNVSVWRISSIKDLGVATRLAAINGFVDYVLPTADDVSVQRIWFSGDETVQQKLLLY
ncbi:MAG: hypothetical protein D6675_13665 [Gemmatimonadetes bacterium]|nr:MAG: hypothetical protein D6675_13665 [Gemmatimonadota bacterium]